MKISNTPNVPRRKPMRTTCLCGLAVALSSLLVCRAAETSGPVLGEEMLKNSGFEETDVNGIQNWSGVPAGFAVTSSTELASAGQRSARMETKREGFNPILTQNVTQFVANQRYRLQYEARTGIINQEYRVYVGIWKGSDWLGGVETQWRAGLPAWQKVAADFTLKGPMAEADRLMVVLEAKGPATVWFDNVSLKPVLSEEKDPTPISQFVGSEKFVQITPERTLLVRGKPFFPIMVWGVPMDTEAAFDTARDFGCNLVLNVTEAYGVDGTLLALDMAEKYGLKILALTRADLRENQLADLPERLRANETVVSGIKSHPALFAYALSDEPVWSGFSLQAFAANAQMIRKSDPNHPLYVNHAPRNTIAELRRFNQYTDIGGSDIYPVWKGGVDNHSDLPNKTLGVVGDETIKNLAALEPHKPVMQTLQGFSWSDGSKDRSGDPFPTREQLRFMGYDSVVCGATGVTYFQDHRYRELRPELKPVLREFHALQDVLAGGKNLSADSVCPQEGIRLLVKDYRGRVMVIAVNRTGQTIPATLDLSRLVKTKPPVIQVLFEDRKIEVADAVARDDFQPWAVHVYLLDEKAPDILRASESLPADRQPVKNEQASHDALVPNKDRNLALASRGVKASASSEMSSMPASVVNDGDRWGNQWNDATINDYPDWVVLEFSRPTRLSKIAIFTRQMPLFGKWFQQGVRDFDVQIEQDGGWKTLRSFRDNKEIVTVVDFEPLTTTGIRILITATNGIGDFSRIMEIEAYGPETNAPTT